MIYGRGIVYIIETEGVYAGCVRPARDMIDKPDLEAMEQLFDKKLKPINERLDIMDGRFVKIDERFVKIDERFVKIDEHFVKIDERFEKMDERFDRMDERFEKMDERFDKMDERFDRMDGRFDKMDERVDKLDQRVVKQEVIQENVTSKKLDLILEILEGMNERLIRHDKTEKTVEDHERRIWALEQTVRSKNK